jgi:hypothetical protein
MSHTSQPTPTAKKQQLPYRQKHHEAAGDEEPHGVFSAGNATNVNAQQPRQEGQRQEQPQ